MSEVRVCMRLDNIFTSDLRVRREAEALAEAGYDITVVADMKPGLGLAERETVNGVKIRRIAKTSRVPYWSIVKPLLEEAADVYHAHDIDSLFPCLAAARLGKKHAKVVYDTHELWSGHAKDKIRTKRRMLIKVEGTMLRASDALITASPAYAEQILARYGYKGPSVTILNVPTFRTDEELAPYWAKRGEDGLVRVTAISVFQHGRGAVPLIEALAHLPENFVVELVGPIPQPEYERLMREAAAPFGDRARIVGPIPPNDIVPRLASADVSAVLIEPLSLSYRLTAPNKLFDSMMAGTPIAASDMRFIGQTVRAENVGEVCEVSDPADVARAILAAYENAAEYGSNGRAAALRYNWGQERVKLVDLYATLTPTAEETSGC
ncbi:MAG: glycosyltransferase [Actinobacteria bacterium]|nr:MAG: glycosyltransferase [Actinomycetota bacterium]